MCVNGDESEPATFNNRLLIELDPHQFIEGILISLLRHQGEHLLRLDLRFEYIKAFRIMERAIAEALAAFNLAGTSTGPASTWRSTATGGPGLHLRRGDRADREPGGQARLARIKPPFPAIEGAFRKPTVVNNVETLARVPHIIERGFSTGSVDRHGPRATGRSSTPSRVT